MTDKTTKGPTPAGPIPRNPDTISQVYVRGGVNLTQPTTDEEKVAVAWWQGLKPDGRLKAITQMSLPRPQTDEEKKAVAWWQGLRPDERLARLVKIRQIQAISKAIEEDQIGHA